MSPEHRDEGRSNGRRGERGPLLVVKGLSKEFRLRRSAGDWVRRTQAERVAAVQDLSFTLKRGETLGIAGESGSGKTTAVPLPHPPCRARRR